MLVLALDTATEDIALALARVDDKTGDYTLLGSADGPAPREANVQLLGRIISVMDAAGLAPSDLDCVVCGRGPGSFTGVRIGVATTKGIATALHVPLHGVSTLDAVACEVYRAGYVGSLHVIDDAMRGEVYPATFEPDGGYPRRLQPDRVCAPDVVANLCAQTAGDKIYLAGNGLLKYEDRFRAAFEEQGRVDALELVPTSLWLPHGEGLIGAFCCQLRADALDSGDAGNLLPIYTRLSDAEENEQHAASIQEKIPASGVNAESAVDGLVMRPMTLADIPAVVDIERRAFPEDAWSAAMFADEFDLPARRWWVALERGELVGYVGGWLVDGQLQILDVATLPERTGEGIATRLMGRLSLDAMDLGAESITLEVAEDNPGAQALYRKLGMEEVGLRPHYYPNGTTALIMTGPLPLPTEHLEAHLGSDSVAGMDLRDSVDHADTSMRREHPRPLILAFESSCDETAAALIDGDGKLHSDVIASQIDFHARFGGVVPEIASRKHIEAIVGVAEEALSVAARDLDDPDLDFCDLDAIAVTTCPGLVGALVVGLAFAKGLAWAAGVPLIAVNHLEGHIYANRLITPDIEPPMVALLVSGGHTMLVEVRDWGDYRTMGETVDDAAGEAFDKVAKALGLGYPGGPVISKLAKQGNPRAYRFPRAMMNSGDLRFSLSGLKTAVITFIKKEQEAGHPINLPDLAASFQQAVVDVQVAKSLTALEQTGATEFCLGGGVAANPVLRDALRRAIEEQGIRVTLPPLSACTDNAGMIAAVALARYEQGRFATFDIDASAHAALDDRY